MICLSKNKDGPDLLIGFLEGTLDSVRMAEISRHAQECAECRGLLGVWNKLEEYPAPVVSSDFDARLYEKIAAANREPWWKRLFWRPVVPITAAVATAVFAVALMVHPGPKPAETAKDVPHIENIEQVEQALQDLELLTPMDGAPADKI